MNGRLSGFSKMARRHLKTSELIAIIIRTGTRALQPPFRSQNRLLQKYDGNLKRLADDNEIQIAEGIKGMGKVKASQLMAAFELGRRMAAFLEEKPQIGSPSRCCTCCTNCNAFDARPSKGGIADCLFALTQKTM